MSVTYKGTAVLRWLSVQDWADRVNVSTKTIRRMVDRGDIPPPKRVGSLLRWPPSAFDEWEASK